MILLTWGHFPKYKIYKEKERKYENKSSANCLNAEYQKFFSLKENKLNSAAMYSLIKHTFIFFWSYKLHISLYFVKTSKNTIKECLVIEHIVRYGLFLIKGIN